MKLTDEERHEIIEKYAYRFYEIRKERGDPPDKDGDWAMAERAVANEEKVESGQISLR